MEHRSPALTASADNLLAISPGVTSQALAQFAGGIWKRPYGPDDIAAAFWGGMLWLACALVVPAATYVAGTALFGARAASHSAALACAVPSLLLFVPGADLSYAACAALALALAAVGSQQFAVQSARAIIPLALGGIVAGIGVTGSFAGAWTILLTLIWLAWRAPTRAGKLAQTGVFGGAALATLAVFQVLGVNWLLFWRSVIAFNVDADVAPLLRFVYHFADFFAFLGVAIVVALGWGLARALKSSTPDQAPTQQWRRDIVALAVPTLLTLLTLNIVISMAETARIWMLFTPPLLVAVGGILAREESPNISRWVLAAQLAQTWIFVVFLNVWSF